MTFTKTEIRNNLMEKMGLSKKSAKEFLEAFFDEIKKELVAGKSVKISNFGNFDLRQKATRPGRNPKTGEYVAVSARRVVTFRVSLRLKQEVDVQHTLHQDIGTGITYQEEHREIEESYQ